MHSLSPTVMVHSVMVHIPGFPSNTLSPLPKNHSSTAAVVSSEAISLSTVTFGDVIYRMYFVLRMWLSLQTMSHLTELCIIGDNPLKTSKFCVFVGERSFTLVMPLFENYDVTIVRAI